MLDFFHGNIIMIIFTSTIIIISSTIIITIITMILRWKAQVEGRVCLDQSRGLWRQKRPRWEQKAGLNWLLLSCPKSLVRIIVTRCGRRRGRGGQRERQTNQARRQLLLSVNWKLNDTDILWKMEIWQPLLMAKTKYSVMFNIWWESKTVTILKSLFGPGHGNSHGLNCLEVPRHLRRLYVFKIQKWRSLWLSDLGKVKHCQRHNGPRNWLRNLD